MKDLFAALFRVKSHVSLFISSIVALIALTIFNQLEVIIFGAVAKSGDHFTPDSGVMSKAILWVQNALGLNVNAFSSLVILFFIVGVFKAIALFISRYLTKILAVRICRDLRNQCFAHLQTLPLSFFSKYDRGKLSTRVISDASQIALSFNSFVTNYIHMPFIVGSTLFLCIILSWQLTAVLFLGIPLVVIPLKWITKKIRKISLSMQQKQESFTSVIIDHLSGIFTIKSYQLEKYSIKKYTEENALMVAFDEKIQKYDMMSRPITHFMMTVMFVSILYIGIHRLHILFPDLIVYCGVLHMLYTPFKQFSDENANVQKGVVAAQRIFDILGKESESNPSGVPLQNNFSKEILFEKVKFSYNDTKILEDLSFSLKKGEVLAIAGSTGSGKSTLLKLFSNLYNIDSGEILFDGISIKNISLESLRKQFAVVTQEPFFFNDTIKSNLIFEEPISQGEMIQATKKACIHEFIMSLPEGYNTVIEEMGKNLSGGQKQRLALARALLRKASILLLDEATSSLDAVNEKAVSMALENMKGEVTQVIVAHRLSTIQHADRVLFLEGGKIVSCGTVEEVLDQSKGFASMWAASQLN